MSLDEIPLIDHHCHGVSKGAMTRASIEALMSESYQPPAPGTNHFQKPLGLAIRRHCAPILGLEPLSSADHYIERRLSLGTEEVNRRLLSASGISTHLIDTGHRASEITTPGEFSLLCGHPAREIVRIETVAEQIAVSGCSAGQFAAHFVEALRTRSADAVGLKSVVAYRSTFKIDQTAPSAQAVAAAAGAWFKAADLGKVRLTDPILLRHGLWAGGEICRERRFPLQLHVGFGDPDVYMHACDPTHFTDFLRGMEAWRVPVTLLHNYPFIREAAWLSEIFQNVYYDVGVVLNFTGASSQRIMAEALELGPWTKQLFSSDAFGLAELHHLGAVLFRRTLRSALEGWMAGGDCTSNDVDEIYAAVAHGNAARIYPLDAEASG